MRWWIFLRPIGAAFTGPGDCGRRSLARGSNVLVANGGEAAARRLRLAGSACGELLKVLATLALERLLRAVGYVVSFRFAATFLELPGQPSRV